MILFPAHREFYRPLETMLDVLEPTGLLGEAESGNRFLAGDRFLSLICFLGCSPHIELAPTADQQPYCFIELGSSPDELQCAFGLNTRPARCPDCRAEINPLGLRPAAESCAHVPCPGCGESLDLAALNWRKKAMFARCWIAIHNVREAEAVPHDSLMTHLLEQTAVSWRIAYLCS